MGQNMVEKIAQRFALGLEASHTVHSDDYLMIRPAYVMTHDNTGAVIPKFSSIGAVKVANPRQIVFALDHDIQNTTDKNLAKYARIEAFAREMNIDFYPAGRGIGHQIMCEEGYAWPGTLVVASDSHSNMYGGLGCLGTPIVRTDAAAIWATGRTWWQVPPVAKVELRGKLRPGVTGKDVIIALCGFFSHDEVLNHAVEFVGDGVLDLAIEQRLTIANMSTEWGALAGIFPVDKVTLEWLRARVVYMQKRGLAGVPSDADARGAHARLNEARILALEQDVIQPDPDAGYARELMLELGTVQPYIAGPNTVKVITPVSEIMKKNLKIHKAYLVSCVNSRVDDLAQAAAVVRGKKVAPGVEFYISAASSEAQADSERRGDWSLLLAAGAIPLPPGCGPCIGLGAGLLQDGETGISATNRNFKGRMGSRNADAYLASPAVVAASAIAGRMSLPMPTESTAISGTIQVNEKPVRPKTDIKILSGFPEKLTGELLFCHQDNLNTDGIFPGKYTYQDDMTAAQQASVVMENYDPEFGKLAQKGDFLVGGFNFGTGSSREQAATALKHRGIALVLAGSFNETYKRNALNNGFLVIEVPELVRDLKEAFGIQRLTVRTGKQVMIDFRQAILWMDKKSYALAPIGTAAQELIRVDGLENWIRKNLESV